ncbi:MAG: thiamine phosphate synthase, partial [Nitrospirales bacterium]
MSASLTGLYVILDAGRSRRPLVDVLREAAAAGARLFQYRAKRLSGADAYREACQLRGLARDAGALFVVNDRCDLALAVEADGVHLGQEDLPLAQARRLLGPSRIIGISTHNLDQVTAATAGGATYLGFGPVYPTASKENPEPVVGIEGLRSARQLTTVPVFAIGGMTADRLDEVRAAGADGVAVIAAI